MGACGEPWPQQEREREREQEERERGGNRGAGARACETADARGTRVQVVRGRPRRQRVLEMFVSWISARPALRAGSAYGAHHRRRAAAGGGGRRRRRAAWHAIAAVRRGVPLQKAPCESGECSVCVCVCVCVWARRARARAPVAMAPTDMSASSCTVEFFALSTWRKACINWSAHGTAAGPSFWVITWRVPHSKPCNSICASRSSCGQGAGGGAGWEVRAGSGTEGESRS